MKGQKELTKQKIIKAAMELIGQKGFKSATTSLIARRAGVSEAVLFKYFGDKKHILKTIINEALLKVFANLSADAEKRELPLPDEHSSILDYLSSVILERWEFFQQNKTIVKILFAEMQFDRTLFQAASRAILPRVDDVGRRVRAVLTDRMGLAADLADSIARMCVGVVAQNIVLELLFSQIRSRRQVKEDIERTLNVLEHCVPILRKAT